jgi:biopolymer transport protein ExbB
MSFNISHILSHMSPVSLAILGVLVAMAVASVGVTFERIIAFWRSSRDSQRFVSAAAPLIKEWKMDELAKVTSHHKQSTLAKLLGPVVGRYLSSVREPEGGLTPVELAFNESDRQKERLGAELRRGMNVLATVGSIAPFVGLLGTVVGIIAAFQGIGASGSGGIAAVSTGIAEALVETAFGLMVAIPAVILFNYLNARVAGIELALNRTVGELMDQMEHNHGRYIGKYKKQAA